MRCGRRYQGYTTSVNTIRRARLVTPKRSMRCHSEPYAGLMEARKYAQRGLELRARGGPCQGWPDDAGGQLGCPVVGEEDDGPAVEIGDPPARDRGDGARQLQSSGAGVVEDRSAEPVAGGERREGPRLVEDLLVLGVDGPGVDLEPAVDEHAAAR